MKKRIIALLLTAVMIFTLLPSAVFAEKAEASSIVAVDICGLASPKAGYKLDYEFTVNGTPVGCVEADGRKAPDVDWQVYNAFSGKWEDISDTEYVCAGGKQYKALVYITAAAGYKFSYFNEDSTSFTGYALRDGQEPAGVRTSGSDSRLCVEIPMGKLPVASSNKIKAVTFNNVPYCCVVGDSVEDFVPASLKNEGKSGDYFWFLFKYKQGADPTVDEPSGVYIPKDQVDYALQYMPELSKAEITAARTVFGAKFQLGCTYMLCNVQILRDGYAYASNTVDITVNYTSGDAVTYEMDTSPDDPATMLPVILPAIPVTKPSAPTLSLTKTDGKIKLSWTASPGADKYYIYRCTDGKSYKYYSSTTKTTYTNSSVTSGTKYYYKVKAINVVGDATYYSGYSNAKSGLPLTTPKLTASLATGKVKLSWDKVSGATKYYIYRSTDGETYKYYTSTTKTSYSSSSMSTGKTYYFKVKAIKSVGSTDYTSSYSAVKSVKIVKAPTISLTKTDGKVKLSWSAVSGAAKYYIYRSTDGKTYKYYTSTTKTSCTNSSVTSGTKYYYKVKAVNSAGGTSAYSNYKSTIPLTTPELDGVYGSGKARLSWDKVSGATKYNIYRSADGETFKLIASTSSTYYNSSISASTSYDYRVRAVKTVGSSDYLSSYSNTVTITR